MGAPPLSSQAVVTGQTKDQPHIHYRIHGTQGEPVILVMGLAMSGRAWDPQIDGLKAHHRVISFDHRGVGRSDAVTGPITMKTMAQDVLRVLDSAGIERAHIVGVSMGGMVTQEVLLAAPERFLSATLIATHAGGVRTWLPPLTSIPDFLRSRVGARRAQFVRRLLYTSDFVNERGAEALEARLAGLFDELKPKTLPAQVLAVFRHRTRRRLASIETPVFVIRGALDRMVSPRATKRLVAALRAPEEWVLPDVGHGLLIEQPEAINDRLLEFFGRCSAA